MSRALSPFFARCYGLARVARVWKISRASVYRSLKETRLNQWQPRPSSQDRTTLQISPDRMILDLDRAHRILRREVD